MTLNLILRPDGSFLLLYSGFLCRFFASAGGPTSLDNIIIFFSKERETFANSTFFFLESNGSKA